MSINPPLINKSESHTSLYIALLDIYPIHCAPDQTLDIEAQGVQTFHRKGYESLQIRGDI